MKRTLAIVLILLLPSFTTACSSVGPGQAGVLWSSWSGTSAEPLGEGAYFVAPWNDLFVVDMRSMSQDEKIDVISVNGLAIALDTAVRYHAVRSEVVKLEVEIGRDYYNKILSPVLRSEARRVMGQYTPEEIYSTKRDVIERQIREGVHAKIDGKHIELEAVLIRNVELPPAIRQAIDRKLAAEQEVLQMKYVLEVARARAEEKAIEAKGIADYNGTVAASLTPPILEYERIRELGQLANSANAKTVVLGPGTNPQVLLGASAAGPK